MKNDPPPELSQAAGRFVVSIAVPGRNAGRVFDYL
jgi:hypothetical protein